MSRAGRLSIAAILASMTLACGDDTPPTQPSPAPTPNPSATVTVTAGRITQSPAGVGVVLATTFTFSADGFSASDNSALTYTWDFGDGTRQTGGATVTHAYPGPGVFTVGATAATAAGASASASLRDVVAATVSGHWGLQVETGTVLFVSTSLTQNGMAVSGDDTWLNCRFTVSGRVVAPRAIDLTWTRSPNACAGTTLPATIHFTGNLDHPVSDFVRPHDFIGTLDSGMRAGLFHITCPRLDC